MKQYLNLMLMVVLAVSFLSEQSTVVIACKILQNGNGEIASLTKRAPSDVPICIILNDQYMFSSQVRFDVYSRVVLSGSYAAVTATQACSDATSIWFPTPLGCSWVDGSYGPGLGRGAPTNYYASVQGVTSNYRKKYASLGTSPAVVGVFPIVTLVISVDNGIVTEVFWDDDCFFNYNRAAGSAGGAGSMDCLFNAVDIDNLFTNTRNQTYNRFLNPTSATTTGYDTLLSTEACTSNIWKDPESQTSTASNEALPNGFCDLGIYVTWVGTSADGQQLGSAGPRFKRFRDYAMLSEYPTVR